MLLASSLLPRRRVLPSDDRQGDDASPRRAARRRLRRRPSRPSRRRRPPDGPPVARTVDVVDKQFGLELADPYRWMEGTDNASYTAWLRAQGEDAAAQLAKIPGRDKLYARLRELGLGVTRRVRRPARRQAHVPPTCCPANAQLAKLAVREADGTTRMLDRSRDARRRPAHVSLNAYSLSPDGKLVAYVISTRRRRARRAARDGRRDRQRSSGSDRADLGRRRGVVAARRQALLLHAARGAAARRRSDDEPGRALHVLGKPVDKRRHACSAAMRARRGSSRPRSGLALWMPPGSAWVVATAGGARSEIRVARREAVASSTLTRREQDAVAHRRRLQPTAIEGAIPHGDRLYLQTFKDAPNRKIISVPLAKPDLATGARRDRRRSRRDARRDLRPHATRSTCCIRSTASRASSRRPWPAASATPIALPYEGWTPDLATDMHARRHHVPDREAGCRPARTTRTTRRPRRSRRPASRRRRTPTSRDRRR